MPMLGAYLATGPVNMEVWIGFLLYMYSFLLLTHLPYFEHFLFLHTSFFLSFFV